MDQQLILLISFLGGTGIELGLAFGLAFSKKSPQRWLMIVGLIGLLWAIFYLAYWWTSCDLSPSYRGLSSLRLRRGP